MKVNKKTLLTDDNGFAYLAFGFFLLVVVVIVSYGFNILQEPTEIHIEFLDSGVKEISYDGAIKTYAAYSDIKNIGAAGTVVIDVECRDDINQNIVYENKKILDLEKNERGNISNTFSLSENVHFSCSFNIPTQVKNSQSVQPLSPQLPITRP